MNDRFLDWTTILKTPKKFKVLVPAQAISKLAFRGGGAKGMVYPGAIKALEELEILNNVDTVAGSSAGSIVATMVALGMSAKEIEEKNNEINFKDLLDPSSKNNVQDRGICDGKILYETFKTIINTQMKKQVSKAKAQWELAEFSLKRKIHMLEQKKSSPEKTIADFKEHLWNLNLLVNNLPVIKNVKTAKVTFRDIANLNKVAKALAVNWRHYSGFSEEEIIPKNMIKDLLITGTNITDETLEVFSAKNHPDMEIALAIRISTSFPIVFKAVEYQNKKFIDGGVMDNLPVRVLHEFSNDDSFKFLTEQQQRQETLSFMLGEEDSYPVLHNPKKTNKKGFFDGIKDYFKTWVCKIEVTTKINELREALHNDYALRTVVLPTHGIETLSMDVSQQKKQQGLESAYDTIKNYFSHRTNEAVDYEGYDLMSCLLQLDKEHFNTNVVDQIVESYKRVNPDLTDEQEKRLIIRVEKHVDFVQTLLEEKHKEAEKILHKIKVINAQFTKLLDLKKIDDEFKLKMHSLATQNTIARINHYNQELVTMLEGYFIMKNARGNDLRVSAWQRKVLFDRLKGKGGEFDKLYSNFSNPAFDWTLINPVMPMLARLGYSSLEKTRKALLAIIKESREKSFQSEHNINILNDAHDAITKAKDFDEMKLIVDFVKEEYKPRSMFSILSLIKSYFNLSTITTNKKLAKQLNSGMMKDAFEVSEKPQSGNHTFFTLLYSRSLFLPRSETAVNDKLFRNKPPRIK